VGTLNPKLGSLPAPLPAQFLDPTGTVWLQTLLLGTAFSLTATVGDSLFALAAGTARSKLRQRLRRGGGLS
jgi:threonine/homoserine/homoserine lactone efflux protein